MALNVFTNVLTAQKIVAAADRRVGSPGYHLNTAGSEDLTAPAYVELQALLDHLAQWFDFPFAADAVNFTVSSRATGLPIDYWRATFDQAWIIDPVSGERTPLALLGHKEWHERVTPSTTGQGLPQFGTIMKNAGWGLSGVAAGTLYVDPKPDRSYLCELHYQPVAPVLTGITTKPWFPDSEYLIVALAAKLASYQDDTRALELQAEADRLMRQIQRGQSDPGQRSHTIPHDVLVFRPPLRLAE